MTLDSSVTVLKGVGEALAKKFAVVGIRTLADLIDYYPRRYEDYSVMTPTSQLRPGTVTIEAVIKQAKGRYVRRGMHITEAVASDEQGSVRLIWFNQPYRADALKPGQKYFISGEYQLSHQRFAIMNPSVEMASDFPLNTARIIAVYRETKGLTSRQVRAAVQQVRPLIAGLPETLPPHIVVQQKLMSYAEAMLTIHTPDSAQQLEEARRRLGFEEVFRLSLASLLNKQENQNEIALEIPFDEQLARDFVSHLPFQLTDAQRRTIWRIYLDLQKTQPMNRMVEGDVGSGKTVVAAMAALMALAQDWQVAFMAPTELLARQHAESIYKLLQALGYADKVVLLVGSLSAAQKKKAHEAIASGQAQFIIGTQALIQDKVDMHRLALIVIDEQHRFGVEQRKTLMAKAGHMPHVLSLTATPIPRSLALTLYGELDISILGDKPVGRQPIITEIISPNSHKQLYEKIDAELEQGRQMFVVCPLITDSTMVEANSAEKIYEQLSKKQFKHRRVGLLHGKLKAADKQAIMQKFVDHELDILVSTTVIEVGVDVPNATIMMIESAERFGLAQLHQLRGRVGRGEHQGSCYLMLDDSKQPSRRLRALVSSNDGFRLAELDLELRGPGAIYGTMQHGQLDLRIAKLSDTKLIAAARTAAQSLLDDGVNLLEYKELMTHVTRLRAVTNLN
ncbi:MAG: recG [Candidatus Saccharibacteria bacterium]|nr:recG [Candidatus Saccharibacteria bacterium]